MFLLFVVKSLSPPEKKTDPNIPIYISLGAVGGAVVLFVVFIHFSRLKSKRGYLLYPGNACHSLTRYQFLVTSYT
ncbi:hypothetical protein EON65_12020 [archaeon]|nr:MAG: hypothetical protein EON65_12020 [archaeon]